MGANEGPDGNFHVRELREEDRKTMEKMREKIKGNGKEVMRWRGVRERR
jgi:hypothetical protein